MVEQQQTEAQPAATDTGTPADAKVGVELERARAEIEGLRAELRERQLRGLAELDNVRKRAEREIATSARYGAEKLLSDLLIVVDSLELGWKAAAEASAGAIAEGLELTHRQLAGVLEKHGVGVVDPLGEPFDPELHEAVATIDQPQAASNQVVEVLQRGYRLHDRLLRPARVVVARAPKTG